MIDLQNGQRAVVTVLGKDQTGIIYHVSRVLYEHRINIVDVSQSVVDDMFHMVMIVDFLPDSGSFPAVSDALMALEESIGKQVKIQRMEIFDAMHRI